MTLIKKGSYRSWEELLKYSIAEKNEMIKKYGTPDLLDLLNDEDKSKWENIQKSISEYENLLEIPSTDKQK